MLGFAALIPAYFVACATAMHYPESRRTDVVDDYFGEKVADPYRWLEDLESADTRAWVAAQNAVSRPLLDALPARGAIRQRLAELWSYERYSVPQVAPSGALVYTRHDALQNQPVLYHQEAANALARVLIDPNAWSEDGTEALVDWKLSPDGRHLAYAVQSGGTDWVEYRVLAVATGQTLPDRVRGVNFNFDFSRIFWRGGNGGFFYSRFPDPPAAAPGAPPLVTNQKLYYHRLGTDQKDDVLVYERPDQPGWFVWGETTGDGRYLLVYVEQTEDSAKQVFVRDLGDPDRPRLDAPMHPLVGDWAGNYYLVGNVGSTLYFRTSAKAPRYRIVAVDLRKPGAWRDVVPESKDVLMDATFAGGEIVAAYLRDASTRLLRFSPKGEARGEIALPGLGTAHGGRTCNPLCAMSGRPERKELYFGFTSFNRPTTVYRHDLGAGASEPFHPPKVAFKADDYVTELVFSTSKDGTRVPLFIARRRDLPPGPRPALLYGYGGFAITQTPVFSVPNLAWMERGGVYVLACLRGGGEYGEAWHEAGMKEKKQNVFDDFIAAGEFLVKRRYTSPSKLAVMGGSNGGLLVGVAMEQRPDLFAVALPAVGVMDMLRYHRFTGGGAWAAEYGSADDSTAFPYLRAYSPVHNIVEGRCYPATLVTTADHDDRVVPSHSFKFAAALQKAQGCAKPVLIRVETQGSHGYRPTDKRIAELADQWAFTAAQMGIMPQARP